MQNRLADAAEFLNFDEEMALLNEMRQDIQEQLARLRAVGFDNQSNEILELEQQYRAFAQRIVSVFDNEFRKARESFDRQFSNLEFQISILSDGNAAEHERLINEQIESRLRLSRELSGQILRLVSSTDAVTRSTQEFRDLLRSLEQEYQANIRSIHQLASAQRSLADSQISDVRSFQNRVVAMIRARHQRERDMALEAHQQRMDLLEAERDAIRDRWQMEIDYVDALLRAYQDKWAEQDRQRRREDEIQDLDEIRRRINELKIAAATGDAEAISRIEDLRRQYADRSGQAADAAERDRRENIRTGLTDRRDDLRDQMDMELALLDKRRDALEAERQLIQEMFEYRLKNENLFTEARKKLQRGVTEELIRDIMEFEKRYGEGRGILGEHIMAMLEQEAWMVNEILKNLEAIIATATDLDLFERLMGGESLSDIFNSLDGSSEGLTAVLKTLTEKQRETIQEMKQNSVAWEKAVTEAERAALMEANTRLAMQQQWFNSDDFEMWYLNPEILMQLYEAIEGVKVKQIESIEAVMQKHEEEHGAFTEQQQSKLLSVQQMHKEIANSTSMLLNNMAQQFGQFGQNVTSFLTQIVDAINQVVRSLGAMSQASAPRVPQPAGLGGPTMQSFSVGGLNRGSGVRFLHDNEQVLTPEQTRAFSELVFGLNSDGMRNITDAIRQANAPGTNVPGGGRKVIEANFNFYAGVTQEALPEVRKIVNDSIFELKREIPGIVATEQRDSLRRIGGR